MTTEAVTMKQLLTAIEVWNMIHVPGRGTNGTCTVSAGEMFHAASLFAEAKWTTVTYGPLEDSRYFKSPHGFVVQSPAPNNELSLIQPAMAASLGIS